MSKDDSFETKSKRGRKLVRKYVRSSSIHCLQPPKTYHARADSRSGQAELIAARAISPGGRHPTRSPSPLPHLFLGFHFCRRQYMSSSFSPATFGAVPSCRPGKYGTQQVIWVISGTMSIVHRMLDPGLEAQRHNLPVAGGRLDFAGSCCSKAPKKLHSLGLPLLLAFAWRLQCLLEDLRSGLFQCSDCDLSELFPCKTKHSSCC